MRSTLAFLVVSLSCSLAVAAIPADPLLLPVTDAPEGSVGLSFVSRGPDDVGAGLWLAAQLRNPGIQGYYARWLHLRGELTRDGAVAGLASSGLGRYLESLRDELSESVVLDLAQAGMFGDRVIAAESMAAVRELPPFAGFEEAGDAPRAIETQYQELDCDDCPAGEGPHVVCGKRCLKACRDDGRACQTEVVPASR